MRTAWAAAGFAFECPLQAYMSSSSYGSWGVGAANFYQYEVMGWKLLNDALPAPSKCCRLVGLKGSSRCLGQDYSQPFSMCWLAVSLSTVNIYLVTLNWRKKMKTEGKRQAQECMVPGEGLLPLSC